MRGDNPNGFCVQILLVVHAERQRREGNVV
jgi:hypothetical protein